MRTRSEIREEIDAIIGEMEDINQMTDDEVSAKFNVDSKDQIISLDNEILDDLYNELEEASEMEEDTLYDIAEEIFGSHEAMEKFLY